MNLICKKKMLMSDYIIHEDLCNFKCEYCLGDEVSSDYNNIINSTVSIDQKCKFTNELSSALDIYEFHVDADILQISGGELFLIKNIIELIKLKSSLYKKIYILSNGFLLNQQLIEQLSLINNVVIGISLDGHTLEMNTYRFKKVEILNIILQNISLLTKNSIPVVINSVLHDKNTKDFKDFMYYLADVSSDICVLPISIRGERAARFRANSQDFEILLNIAQDTELTKIVNFVPAYFEALYYQLKNKKKSIGCWVPLFATELFHTGELSPCPLYWLSSLGNIRTSDAENIINKIGNDKIYRLLVRKPVRMSFCHNCFSSYDLINLYFQDKLPIEFLKRIPFYNHVDILQNITDLKMEVIKYVRS